MTNYQKANYQKARVLSSVLAAVILAGGCSLPSAFLSRDQPNTEPESLDRLLTFGRLHERQGKSQEAIQIYEQILKNEPDQPLAHHRMGVLAAKAGDVKGAISHFETAHSNGSPTPELLADLGYALYLTDDFVGAEHHLRQSLNMAPESQSAHNNLGLVLAEMKRFDEAIGEFAQGGPEAAAYANLAYVQSQHGVFDEAKANYLHALELDPELRPAAEALIQLAQHSGELEPGQGTRRGPKTLLARRPPPQDESEAEAIVQVSHAFGDEGSNRIKHALASASTLQPDGKQTSFSYGSLSASPPPVTLEPTPDGQGEQPVRQLQAATFVNSRPATSLDRGMPLPEGGTRFNIGD